MEFHSSYIMVLFMTAFTSLGIPSFLNDSLKQMNITLPTPIQGQAIPPGLEGLDILASAQTGTGKTIAYLIPLLTNMMKDSTSTALIMAPTRELAAQIQDIARALMGRKLETALLIGGDSMGKQLSILRRNPRMIIGTPGRINDHLTRNTLRLNETRFLVLDETDRMLDMGFSEVLKKIVGKLPRERQTFMFSATMPPAIKTLSMAYLNNPQHISIIPTKEGTPKIKQETVQTSAAEKYTCLVNELNTREGSVIIFVKTKHGADRLAEKLIRQNHHAAAMHGDLKQRKREDVVRDFRNLKKRIMVATDIAARGLDIPHIKHVINYDPPQCPEDYIHRIGRTGRAGMEGSALSLISPEDYSKWRRIPNLLPGGKAPPSAANTDRPRRKPKFGAGKGTDSATGFSDGPRRKPKFGAPGRGPGSTTEPFDGPRRKPKFNPAGKGPDSAASPFDGPRRKAKPKPFQKSFQHPAAAEKRDGPNPKRKFAKQRSNSFR